MSQFLCKIKLAKDVRFIAGLRLKRNKLSFVMRLAILLSFLSISPSIIAQNTNSLHSLLAPEALTRAGSIIQRYVDNNEIAGGVALVAQKGEIIYNKAFGLQSIENQQAMNENSLFQIASMTKPITTVALLMLMEEGKVKLDDPITKYLPDYSRLKVEGENGIEIPVRTPLTLMHFLTHTSGLPNGGHPAFKEKINLSKINSLKEYVDAFTLLPLVHQPGEKFTYGLSTNVIGRVVEIVSGLPFEVFIKQRIFDPLKMESTYFFIPESDLNRFSSLYKPTDDGLVLVQAPTTHPVKFVMGNGGLTSSAHDYYRFAQMLLNGGELDGQRLLKKQTVELMTSNHLPNNLIPLNVMGTILPNTGFGLGVAVIVGDKEWSPAPLNFSNMGNLPAGSYYWPGITNTYWWADPEHEIVGVLLTQSTDPGRTTIFQEFHNGLYKNIYNSENHIDGGIAGKQSISEEERTFLIDHMKGNRNELIGLVKGLSKKQLDFKFDPERWSIRECVEHIAITENSLWEWAASGLNEPANPALRAEVKVNEKMIIARLSDRTNKLEAPQEARPTGKYAKVKDALDDYEKRRESTIAFVESTQEDLRSHFVKHHVAGTIDVYMALVLLSAHQSRHNLQIREIMGAEGFPKR